MSYFHYGNENLIELIKIRSPVATGASVTFFFFNLYMVLRKPETFFIKVVHYWQKKDGELRRACH